MNLSEAFEDPIKKTTTAQLLVYGEVLYDCFPEQHRVLGGAPFNVAWGLKGLGQDPLFISAVGQDSNGYSIQGRMKDWGMALDGLQVNGEYKTGEVFVTIGDDEPSYEICNPRAWDFIEDEGFSGDRLIYHGLLSLRNEKSAQTFEAICNRSKGRRFLDVNLRPPYYSIDVVKKWIRDVYWLKLNLDELSSICEKSIVSLESSEPYVQHLRNQFGVENVLLTAGSEGALVQGDYGNAICSPAPKVDSFVDTVGAGDSFAAVMIDGILKGDKVEDMVQRASQFAAKVCGLQGATSEDKTFYQE